MKKFAVILAVLFVVFAINAYAVHDNSGTKTGTGSFSCDIIQPLSIANPTGSFDLGDFVASAVYTTGLTNNVMNFVVTGEPNYGYYYKITEDEAGTGTGTASLTIDWTWTSTGAPTLGASTSYPATLTAGGGETFTATVSQVTTGATSGSRTFSQTVVVGYNSF